MPSILSGPLGNTPRFLFGDLTLEDGHGVRSPVQSLAPTDPLCPVPQPTPHNGATGWPDPRKMSRSDPTRKMNARMSDSEVRGLIRSGVLWYFPAQAKRPFIIPIPT